MIRTSPQPSENPRSAGALAPARISVVFAIPTPPPYSGPETVGELLLRADFAASFERVHVRTGVNHENLAKGRVHLSSLLTLARVWLALVRALRRTRPRLVYMYLSQNWTGFVRDAIVIATSRLSGALVIVHVHGSNFGNFYDHAGPWRRLLIRRVVRLISTVLVLAEKFRPQFKHLCPSVEVVANPVAIEDFTRTPRAQAPPGSPVRIVFLGHLSAAKGFFDVVNAATSVLEACPTAYFDFAGEWVDSEKNIFFDETGNRVPHDQAALVTSWSRLQARFPDRVRHWGVVRGQDKVAFLHQADALVLPSYSEGLPMAVLEAMACGLPLVVTPVGALPEFLVDSVNALFVPPGQPMVLAQALVALVQRPETRAAMGAANRELVASRFGLPTITAQLTARFTDTMAQAGTPRRVPALQTTGDR